jgi:hypothetical protein
MVRNWSILGAWGMDLRGYLGFLGRRRVLGRWNVTEKRCLRDECECTPWSAAFLAALALTLALALVGAIFVDDVAGRI